MQRMGETSALNSLRSILTPSSGTGGQTEEDVYFFPLLIFCFTPTFVDLMLKDGQGSH